MLNYFRNKKSGGLIALDSDTNEITEFEPLSASAAEKAGGGVEHLNRKKVCRAEKIKPAGKAKGGRECVDCGKTVPPGKYLCKGKCSACYAKDLYHRKHGGKAKSESRVNEYECIDCGAEIKSTLDINQVKCPKNSNHTMVQK